MASARAGPTRTSALIGASASAPIPTGTAPGRESTISPAATAASRMPTARSETLGRIAAGDVPGRVAIRATSIGARRHAIARRARPRDRSGTTLRLVAARRRLLCIYQHAPTPGAPGIYRHRLYLAELVRRGWDVDLISTPVNYMRGTVPERYAGKPYVRETIDGIVHHWVWASTGVHRSRVHRAANYASFATAAAIRGATLPRPDVIWASSPPLPVGTVGEVLAARFRRPWVLEVRDLWPESAVSVGWLREGTLLYRGLDRLARRYARRADAALVPTPGLAEPLHRHGAPWVAVVPGPVLDTARSAETRERMRADLG